MLLRNQLYAGIIDVPEYGVRGKRGDFEPLISEELFYRVQAIQSGRVPSTAPRKRARRDLPLRAFVRCAVRAVTTIHTSKCRLANARPEPDLRQRSKRIARDSSENAMTTCRRHGRCRAECGHRPALWSSTRAAR